MNLFLTGPRGIGKSTVLRRGLSGLPCRAAGLMTCFDAPRGSTDKKLWLLPWSTEPDFGAGAVCARMGSGERQVFPEVFEDLGIRLLEAAERDPGAGLILLDELGYLEAAAPRFRETVLRLLAGPRPVAGVVRQGLGAWGDAPFGELWEVTEENRDLLPERLAQWVQKGAFCGKCPKF